VIGRPSFHSAPENAGAQPSAPSASSASVPKSNSANGFAAEPLRTVADDADGSGGGNPPTVRTRSPPGGFYFGKRLGPISPAAQPDLGVRIGGQEAEELMLALDRARCGATHALPRRPDARKGLVRTVGGPLHSPSSRAAVASSRFRFGAAIGCSGSDPVISTSSMSSDV
jgi:hypothetical protein